MDFEPNRIEGKKFKAKIAKNMLVHKKDEEIEVQYYDFHYGQHMWKDLSNTYLVLYESEIALISEVEEKVA